jgi:hypothetical protein
MTETILRYEAPCRYFRKPGGENTILGPYWILSLAETVGEDTFPLAFDKGRSKGDSHSTTEVASG